MIWAVFGISSFYNNEISTMFFGNQTNLGKCLTSWSLPTGIDRIKLL